VSAALYSERLFWSATGGIAKKWGREVKLTAAPVLPGCPLRFVFVDYARQAGTAEVQEVGKPQRGMTDAEIMGAEELLDQLRGKP
jgi:hypothetical protein